MKITGIILIIIGALVLVSLGYAQSQGQEVSLMGPLVFIVVGAYLLSRANKKKEKELNKKNWIEGEKE